MLFIHDEKLWDQVTALCADTKTGCYKLFSATANGKPRAIPRILSQDEDGILYIGASTNLPFRMAALKKAISASYLKDGYVNPGAHNVGPKMTPAIRADLPFESFYVSVHPCELTPDEVAGTHFIEEARLLRAYADRFGEFPPFNG